MDRSVVVDFEQVPACNLARNRHGFAYQPKGETSITGVGGVTLPISSLTQTSRSDTPFGHGAGVQETVTALNALRALVIGLGQIHKVI